MSSFAVTAELLTVEEHPDADALELARVGGYRAVVPKGRYRTGDVALYIPEQSVLSDQLIAELGLTGRLSGSAKNRVKAVRLRGALSQGIVCLPKQLAGVDLEQARKDRTDFAEQLGVTKWVPRVPVHMSGQLEACPQMLAWVEVENVKRHPDAFVDGERVVATEKVHGTSLLCGVGVDADGEVDVSWVTSKGHGSRRMALVECESNLYWRAVRAHGLLEVARSLTSELGAVRVGLHGEVYGRGVQDLNYGAAVNEVGFVCFDVSYDVGDGVQRWVDAVDLATVLAGRVAVAPVLYYGPWDAQALTEVAHGPETLSGQHTHIREGVVVRTAVERFSEVLGGRAMAKVVSEAYLTRKGGTEYE